MNNILSILIFFPVILSLPVLFINKNKIRFIKIYSLSVSLITFLISLYLMLIFNTEADGFQFAEKVMWIKLINVQYFVAIDGISLLLIMLTTFIMPLCILASWNTINERVKEFYFLLIILEGAL
ncbi:MAG: hypothetical protein L0Y76_07100, partial [Ignavibacteria bacterium]|nr:hypothetical protein [Ignavibacteria bacterium]